MRKRTITAAKATPATEKGIVITDDTNMKMPNEKREKLKEMSAAVKPLVEAGTFTKLNEAIIATYYKNETHQEFKTFNQWIAAGYRVRKGEKAFCVWAKPLSKQLEAKGQELGEAHDFFPMCFLFSNAQVEALRKK